MTTYDLANHEATHYEELPLTAPCDFSQVSRRCTADLQTGDVIDDDHKIQSRLDSFRTREVPGGPRKIRTTWYYTDPPEDAVKPDPQDDTDSEISSEAS